MADDYDPRYLAGIVLFNRGDFFEAHEVWEDLWTEADTTEKTFYQGLIQAAVGLCHFCNGNVRGAKKLYVSSHDYMERYGSHFNGLNNEEFWQQMSRCFAPVLNADEPDRSIEIVEEDIPVIKLDPEPESWPDPEPYLEEEGE